MNIIIAIVLLYLSIGLFLVIRNMRGLMVSATLGEWLFLILLWPFALRFYIFIVRMHDQIKSLKEWAESEKQE